MWKWEAVLIEMHKVSQEEVPWFYDNVKNDSSQYDVPKDEKSKKAISIVKKNLFLNFHTHDSGKVQCLLRFSSKPHN